MSPGRIEFVILRTGRSPPAALHHASLRRSCIRLQAGERLPGEDFHLSERARFQARVRRGSAPPSASKINIWAMPLVRALLLRGQSPNQGLSPIELFKLTAGQSPASHQAAKPHRRVLTIFESLTSQSSRNKERFLYS